MTKQVEMVYGEEIALVQVNKEGRVEVVREGKGTEVLNAKYDFDAAVKQFETHGWTSKALQSANKQNIPLSVQQEVDEYLKLHAMKSEIEAKMKKQKEAIKTYMDNNNVKAIFGSEDKQIYLQDALASNATANFSNYELQPVMATLNNNDLLRQVTEVRINSDKLEALLKLDKLPSTKVEEIRSLKIAKQGTPKFSVKK